MKFFRYLIFISVLTSLFVLIYKKSDKTGFKRWQSAFKTAFVTAAVVSGVVRSIDTQQLEF